MTTSVTSHLPASLSLDGRDIELRLMGAGDRDAMVRFARALPHHDLLFLRRDITDPEQVGLWIEQIERGNTVTIAAVSDGEIVGYATVDRGNLAWTSHVAELRVLVGEKTREHGLGLRLTQEAFDLALDLGVQKMVAQMTIDQQGAVHVFESMGFRPEALLRDHVMDRDGKTHDLLILSQQVAHFRARRAALGFEHA